MKQCTCTRNTRCCSTGQNVVEGGRKWLKPDQCMHLNNGLFHYRIFFTSPSYFYLGTNSRLLTKCGLPRKDANVPPHRRVYLQWLQFSCPNHTSPGSWCQWGYKYSSKRMCSWPIIFVFNPLSNMAQIFAGPFCKKAGINQQMLLKPKSSLPHVWGNKGVNARITSNDKATQYTMGKACWVGCKALLKWETRYMGFAEISGCPQHTRIKAQETTQLSARFKCSSSWKL